MKLTKYFENIADFKNEEAKLNLSSILKYYSKRKTGFAGFGKRWETLLMKYFKVLGSENIEDTNVGNVQSAFSDFKIGDLYVSLKWVENRKSFQANLLDNFTGDTAWLLTNTTFMETKVTGDKGAWAISQYNNNFKGLKPTTNNFAVLICCYIQEGEKSFLSMRLSSQHSGKDILSFCKKRMNDSGGKNQRLNAGAGRVGKDIFSLQKEENIELIGEAEEIANFKEMIKDDILRKSWKNTKDFKTNLNNIIKKIK